MSQSFASFIENLSSSPVWLTESYIEKWLRLYYKDETLKVSKMSLEPALGRGNNYCGILTRLKVSFCRDSFSQDEGQGFYIVKSSFEGDSFASQLIEPYDVFNRELYLYEKIIPKMKALLKEIKDPEEIFAEAIAIDYEHKAIILEDLNERRFYMPDRLKGLNASEVHLTLRKLAKMHAASAVLNEREDGLLLSFDRGMFNRHTDNYAPLFLGLIEACSRQISKWNDHKFTKFAKKLQDLKPFYLEKAKRVFDVRPEHLNVLTHGDLWTTNILIKHDLNKGDIEDLIIIDFQYAVWGSPAIDLFYFLNTSLQTELHFDQQTELIHYYYNILCETLKKLDYPLQIPEFDDFHLQLSSKEFYALHSSLLATAVQRNEATEDADFHALMASDERAVRFKDRCYSTWFMEKRLKLLMPLYESRRLLDVYKEE